MAEEAKKIEEEAVKTEDQNADVDSRSDQDTPEQKLIRELEGKAKEAERRAAQAEADRDHQRARSDAARKEVQTAEEKRIEAQENSIKSALSGAKGVFEAAQREWDDAYDSGDKAKLRAATEKLNDAQLQLRSAEYHQTNFDNWKKSYKPAEVSKTESRFTPKEEAWIEKNPRFNSDPEFRSVVYGADAIARERGIEIDSDKYFDLIESQLKRFGFRDEVKKESEKTSNASAENENEEKKSDAGAKKQEKKASSTAAPVGGATGSGSSGKKKTLTLTPDMRAAAAIVFPDLHKKDPKAAEEKYAAYQLDIAERRARGEKI